jgi:YhgE/Pip-like protein
MTPFSGAWSLARLEAGLLRRSRSLAWAALGVALIPALYALIYLEAVWDPASRTGALPALIVDLDEGAVWQGQRVRLGSDVVRTRQARQVFAFQLAPDEAAARREVRAGRSLFVLVIPRDFTASAMSAERPGSGRLLVYASEGNHYAGAGLARRFAAELGHQVNEAINERRWAMVLGAAAGTGASLQELRAGVSGLLTGARAQADGLRRAADAVEQWNAGAGPVFDGVRQLTDGVRGAASLAPGVVAGMAPPERLDELDQGVQRLRQGATELKSGLATLLWSAGRLAAGVALVEARLPAAADPPGGTPAGTPGGLAAPVEPQVQIDAPVPNEGTAHAPSSVPVALWLGAVMVGFLFPLRQLPQDWTGEARWGAVAGKFMLPALLVLAQAAAVLAMMRLVLDIRAAHPWALAATLAVTSLTFMAMTLALVRAFGDAGKALASILLILQLSAAGGIVPIELSSSFFRELNPWLPFTWVVRAVRACLFGAYDDAWALATGLVALAGLAALVLAACVGRWRRVPPERYGPALDL